MIPDSEWVWCGYAGHFIGASDCQFHMHTRVGDFRISTVGDYFPSGLELNERREIGHQRWYETFVFAVEGDGIHGEGEVTDWSEIETMGYGKDAGETGEAERGHMEMCRKYAEIGVRA